MDDIRLIWEAYTNILKESIEGRLAEHNAKELFGSDDAPGVRGYIYQDGEYLNLRDGADHREINYAYYPDEETGLKEVNIPSNDILGSSNCMIHFMNEAGAVRWARTGNLLVMSYIKKPTQAQRRSVAIPTCTTGPPSLSIMLAIRIIKLSRLDQILSLAFLTLKWIGFSLVLVLKFFKFKHL